MSTRIGVTSTSYQVERRDWLLGLHGTDPGANPSATLDVSAFTEATHYPDGYIPSGTAVSLLAGGLWGPFTFDPLAPSGEHGLTISAVSVDTSDLTQDVATGLVQHGFVDYNKLPAGGRPVIADARAALPQVNFTTVTP